MTAIKSLSDNSNTCVISVFASVDYFFLFKLRFFCLLVWWGTFHCILAFGVLNCETLGPIWFRRLYLTLGQRNSQWSRGSLGSPLGLCWHLGVRKEPCDWWVGVGVRLSSGTPVTSPWLEGNRCLITAPHLVSASPADVGGAAHVLSTDTTPVWSGALFLPHGDWRPGSHCALYWRCEGSACYHQARVKVPAPPGVGLVLVTVHKMNSPHSAFADFVGSGVAHFPPASVGAMWTATPA